MIRNLKVGVTNKPSIGEASHGNNIDLDIANYRKTKEVASNQLQNDPDNQSLKSLIEYLDSEISKLQKIR